MSPRPVVAIDGPSGSGKSTVSRRVAAALGVPYLDTGAMYRAVTWAVLQRGIDPTDAAKVAAVLDDITLTVTTDPAAPDIAIDGQSLAAAVRTPEVTQAVSAVSAVAAVRRRLVAQQQDLLAGGGVAEGRDIGTVVAPNATTKIFLTASNDARAERRARELAVQEVTAVRDDLDRRDRLDSSRAHSPFAPAEDAVHLDTTTLGIDEVVAAVLELVRQATA